MIRLSLTGNWEIRQSAKIIATKDFITSNIFNVWVHNDTKIVIAHYETMSVNLTINLKTGTKKRIKLIWMVTNMTKRRQPIIIYPREKEDNITFEVLLLKWRK